MRWLLATAALIGTPAFAAPTYLECTLANGDWSLPVELSVDEDNQQAVIAITKTNTVDTRRALFSPSEVKIFDKESTWIVDRSTLSIKREVVIGDRHSFDTGKCRLKPAPAKRAF